MAAAATVTILENGERNLVALVNISGTTGDLSASTLIDRSAYAPAGTKLRVDKIDGVLDGFTATLSFDATADLAFAQLPDGVKFKFNWMKTGGVKSPKAGAGASGDILITTTGFTGSPDRGTFTLWMRKS